MFISMQKICLDCNFDGRTSKTKITTSRHFVYWWIFSSIYYDLFLLCYFNLYFFHVFSFLDDLKRFFSSPACPPHQYFEFSFFIFYAKDFLCCLPHFLCWLFYDSLQRTSLITRVFHQCQYLIIRHLAASQPAPTKFVCCIARQFISCQKQINQTTAFRKGERKNKAERERG